MKPPPTCQYYQLQYVCKLYSKTSNANDLNLDKEPLIRLILCTSELGATGFKNISNLPALWQNESFQQYFLKWLVPANFGLQYCQLVQQEGVNQSWEILQRAFFEAIHQ